MLFNFFFAKEINLKRFSVFVGPDLEMSLYFVFKLGFLTVTGSNK